MDGWIDPIPGVQLGGIMFEAAEGGLRVERANEWVSEMGCVVALKTK